MEEINQFTNIFGHIMKELHRTIEGAFCSTYWYTCCNILQRCFI